MSKPLHSEEEIIATGEELTTTLGELPSAWQVHQKLGGRGKYERYERVWDDYCATRSKSPTVELALPEATEVQIEKAVEAMRCAMAASATDLIRTHHDQSRRQLSIVMRDHEEQMNTLRVERDYLKHLVGDLESLLDKHEQDAKNLAQRVIALERELADAAPSGQPPEVEPPVARKFPDRAPEKTRPVALAAAGTAADTAPASN